VTMEATIVENELLRRTGRPRGILIVPLYDMMVRQVQFRPNIVRSSYHYDWDDLQRYQEHQLHHHEPGMHFFVQFVNTDWAILTGAPLHHRSWFLDDLAAAGAIDPNRATDLVVAVQDDYRTEPLDTRMADAVCARIIAPMMKVFGLASEQVRFIDEILRDGAHDRVMEQPDIKKHYDLQPAVYYDHRILQFALKRFL